MFQIQMLQTNKELRPQEGVFRCDPNKKFGILDLGFVSDFDIRISDLMI